jgi:hypothetical protein
MKRVVLSVTLMSALCDCVTETSRPCTPTPTRRDV